MKIINLDDPNTAATDQYPLIAGATWLLFHELPFPVIDCFPKANLARKIMSRL